MFRQEAEKLMSQFAQTVMDVKGLQCKVLSTDEDLKATSEVAASTSEYLDKANQDYKMPERVDYENVITPSNTPVRQIQQEELTNHTSPLLGVANHEC